MNQQEVMDQRERTLAISQRELEAARADMEAHRSTALAGLVIGMFVAFVGGFALGALVA